MCAALSSFLLLRFENGKLGQPWVSHGSRRYTCIVVQITVLQTRTRPNTREFRQTEACPGAETARYGYSNM